MDRFEVRGTLKTYVGCQEAVTLSLNFSLKLILDMNGNNVQS